MSLSPHSPGRKRFSRHGFLPLSGRNKDSVDMASAAGNQNDATIDIPLEQVTSNGAGLRKENSNANLSHYATTESQKEKRKFMTRGRRQQAAHSRGTGRVGYDGEEDTINVMGRIYHSIRDFSIITRYLLYVVPLAAAFAIPIVVGATAARSAAIGGVPIRWFFTWVEVVWISIWVSKIVVHFLPRVFEIFAGVVSSGVRKYSLVLRSLEIPLSLVGWAVTSLATFVPIMTRNPYNIDSNHPTTGNWVDIVQKILGAAVVSSLVFLGEKFIIQLLSINYHRKQFNARIKDSKRHIYLLGQLYDASRTLFPMYCHEFAEEDYMISDQLNIVHGLTGKGKHGHKRSGSATPMRIIQDLGRYGDKITSAFGNVASEITGRQVFNPNSAHSIVIGALEKKRTSEALAKRIWMSFVVAGHESLYIDDVHEVLGPDRRELADEAFSILDQDANGDVSLDEMIMTVTEFGRERKSIATSMHDVDQAINVLDSLLCAVVMLAVVLIFVAFLNKSFVTTLATTGTALLSLSFVFSVTAQEVLGSCIFLFVKHPFDIGDRVDILDNQLVVEHISLLFTVFRRVTGANIGRTTQIPNIVLNTLWIENISRSKAMSEQFEINISFDTPFDDLQILKTELTKFVTDKDNSREFYPQIELGILGTSDQSKLTLQLEVKHKSNWANETVRQSRRSKFMCALVSALKAVPIYGPGGGSDAQGSSANPSYSVTVSTDEAKTRVADAAAARTAARLMPVHSHTEAKEDSLEVTRTKSRGGAGTAGLSQHDAHVVSQLTSVNPAYDPARDEAWTSSRDDGSTLDERQEDLDQMKQTLLRRASTQGKRQPGVEVSRTMSRPGFPSIPEPSVATNFASPTSYENVRPMASTYAPYGTSQQTPYEPTAAQSGSTFAATAHTTHDNGYAPHRLQSFDQGDDEAVDPRGYPTNRGYSGI